jgi:predicted aspartyl protease
MAIDFPASPTNGQTFTSGALVYTYDGTKWTAQPAGVTGGTKIEVGNTKAEIVDTGSDGRFVVTTEGSERLRVNSAGEIGLAGANYGTSGQVLTSGGTGAAPTWSTPAAADKISEGNTSAEVIDTGSDGRFVVTTEGTERARVDSSGRLLVGTSSTRSYPSYGTQRVLIEGLFYQDASLTIHNNEASTNGANIFLSKSRGTSLGSVTQVSNGDEIGTVYFAATDGTANRLVASVAAWVDGATGSSDIPSRLVFSTTADGASSPTERMRITNGGYFKATSSGSYSYSASATHELVNNDSGSQPVLRASHTHASAPFGIYVNYTGGSPNGNSNPFFFGGDTGGTRFAVNSNGGIANYSANNTNLSDRNAKKDITPAAGTWDCLKDWEIVNFRYKDQPDDADLNLGVIAQQVAESCPEVITVFQEAIEATETEPAQEERLGVKDQQMMWMAIKALQEAQLRIEALEAEVTALKAQ